MRRLIFGLRAADALTILFLLFLSVLTIIFWEEIPKAPFLMSIYVSLLVSQIIVILFQDHGRLSSILHDIIFPVACVLFIFDSLGWIVHYVHPEDVDFLLIRLDYLIFKAHPTVLLERITSPLLTDILQLAYTSYYFIPLIFAISLIRDNRTEEFDKTLFLVLLCFYLSYIGYILMPAIGPRFTIDHLQTTELHGLFIAGPIQKLLNQLEGIKRDAFPSGHTAIPLVILYLSFRIKRRLFYAFLPMVSALIFSTVYCRYHYVVDVIGGIALAVLTILFGQVIYDWWIKEQQGFKTVEKVYAYNPDRR
jgi:membrane-associated phospholipid phosphatase